ncbi:hypothetical protein [Nitrospirillum amazonense]|uniref:hypothetical protein n=1 Tax=Nitrospirillum amazonense TaxID=28077 RepID=UPI0011A7D781|nr:hypothetical protein [Nitrospirillum amazonense]
MDDILASIDIGDGRSVYVATLSRQALIESSAEHLGFGGFFLFETCDEPGRDGISVLAKASSFEAALRLADLWLNSHATAQPQEKPALVC